MNWIIIIKLILKYQRLCQFHKKYETSKSGKPGKFSRALPSEACRIYCLTKDDPIFKWRPLEAVEVAREAVDEPEVDLEIPYFPEGTWCHRDSRQIDYFCRHQECQPHY